MPERVKSPVLLVDDEPDMLFSLQGLLRRDFDVRTAESGQQALAMLEERPAHVIMSDQRMPGMTGVQFLSRAHVLCPDAVPILFTGYADIKAVIDAVNQGRIYHYVTKPWDPDDLVQLLRDADREYQSHAGRERLLVDLRDFVTDALASTSNGALRERGGALLKRLSREV
ncbi:MAG TPA: response regulator [Pirellulales bacterium]|jgi:DNA-binding NtrC family response regulator|nr:response regulator [Pirellulales bacterium]